MGIGFIRFIGGLWRLRGSFPSAPGPAFCCRRGDGVVAGGKSRQQTAGAAEFSTVTKLEVIDSGPGFAEVTAEAVEGFPRSSEHCSWTCGLMYTLGMGKPWPAASSATVACSHGACCGLTSWVRPQREPVGVEVGHPVHPEGHDTCDE